MFLVDFIDQDIEFIDRVDLYTFFQGINFKK